MGVRHCKTNSSFSSGKRWVEVYVDEAFGTRNIGIGLVDASVSLLSEPVGRLQVGNLPSAGNQVGINRDGTIFENGSPIAALSYLNQGDTVSIAADLDTGTVQFSVNGGIPAYASIPVGPSYYVSVGVEPLCTVTTNLFQHIAFTSTPLPGYTDWDGNPIGGPNPPSNSLSIEVY